jgi:hypothetical protein
MSAHTVRHGFNLNPLRATLHLPQFPATRASRLPTQSGPAPGWLERLAGWAERQPTHHHLGSYMRFR